MVIGLNREREEMIKPLLKRILRVENILSEVKKISMQVAGRKK
jgi:hypothetical protein